MSFSQIFVANSSYSLFAYLLMFPDKIDNTLFIGGTAIKDIRVPVKMLFDIPDKTDDIDCMGNQLIQDVQNALDGKKVACYGNANAENNPFIHEFINRYPFYA